MARKVWGGRALLNQPGHHSTAAIVAEIENTANWLDGKTRDGRDLDSYNAQPECTFVVADCDKKINLEIDLGSEARLENSLYKIDTMIDVLKRARKGITIEHERLMRRQKHVPTERNYGGFDN